MSVPALAGWVLGRRSRQPLGATDGRRAEASQLRRGLGWMTAAGGALATLAAAGGAALGDRRTPMGVIALVVLVAIVPLVLRGLASPVEACLHVAMFERASLRAELEAARKATDALRGLAYHDGLTGLPNRSLLYDRLGVAIRHSHRQGTQLAVLFVDLDDFKNVNDSLGHAAGDLVLVELAGRLREGVRAGDTVARLGGDEFVVLLNGVSGADDAAHVAAKLLAAVRAPFRIDGHAVRTTASLGLSLYPANGTSPDELVRSADAAMYRHKERQSKRGDAIEGAA